MQLKLETISRAIWEPRLDAVSFVRRVLLKSIRMIIAVLRDLLEGQLTLRAMSLVYTTLLSMVPLLALSFSVLKAFGVHNQIEPMLIGLLEPLGEKGLEVGQWILRFVDNLKVGVLGAIGLALLVYTAISLIQKIERSFNYIWHVNQSRKLMQRFSDYLSVILIGPVLVFSALGLTASVMNGAWVQSLLAVEPFGQVVLLLSKLAPYLLIIGAFWFVYVFIPNTRVKLGAALGGAIIGGILWQTAGWAFASFVVTSTKYSAIYSGFAILVIFMIWLYLSWLVLLIGAAVSFYFQHPEYIRAHPGVPRVSGRLREVLAVTAMVLIGKRYVAGTPGWSMDELTQRLHIPVEALSDMLVSLESNGMLAQTLEEPPRYLPARDMEAITIKDILEAIRCEGEMGGVSLQHVAVPMEVENLMQQVYGAQAPVTAEQTLKALLQESTPE